MFIICLKIEKYLVDWLVRIHHNMEKDDDVNSSWTIFHNILDFGSHVDLCNITKTVNNWKMKNDLFAMTWRWVNSFALPQEIVDTYVTLNHLE